MIDIQIYNKNKEAGHHSNLNWRESYQWLDSKIEKEIDKIDIQLYSAEEMPIDSIEDLKTIEEAKEYIKIFFYRFKKGEYLHLKVY
jgi:hypothetical protein